MTQRWRAYFFPFLIFLLSLNSWATEKSGLTEYAIIKPLNEKSELKSVKWTVDRVLVKKGEGDLYKFQFKGNFSKNNWRLLLGEVSIKVDEKGNFSLDLSVTSEGRSVMLTAVGPDGESEQGLYVIYVQKKNDKEYLAELGKYTQGVWNTGRKGGRKWLDLIPYVGFRYIGRHDFSVSPTVPNMSALIEGGIEANFLRYFGIGIFGGYGLALSKTYEVGGSARLSFAHLSLLEDSLIPSSVFSGIAFSLVVDGFYYSYIEGTPSGSTFPPSYFEFRYGASMMTRFRKLPLIINSTIQITRLNLSMLVSPSISMGWLF